jgi:hypothetical protein
MKVKVPPRMATWLLRHLGPTYQKESLIGDLHEEYQRNGSQAWYWGEVRSALCIGWMQGARRVGRRFEALYLGIRVRRLATSIVLRLSIEVAALLGILALAEPMRSACPLGQTADVGWLITLIGGFGLCLSVGLYLSLCRPTLRRAFQRTPSIRNAAPIRRLIGVFAVTALSAGTLTWARGAAHMPQQCLSQSNWAATTADFNPVSGNVSRD